MYGIFVEHFHHDKQGVPNILDFKSGYVVIIFL